MLPSDCYIFYFGEIILTTEKENQFINNIYSTYMKITYDTDLDSFINIALQKPGQEELDTINRMLSSTDESVVGMGLKLLTNYDLSESICSIGIIIANNWNNITRSTVSNSVGFEHVLSLLKIDKHEFSHRDEKFIINKLYDTSTNDNDKMKARNIVVNKVALELQKTLDRYRDRFPNLNLSFNFTVE